MRQARIRMYRQGLGDCFLLSFPRGGARTWHVMIDCGALKGTPRAKARLTAVARDIVETTGGHLDVLVATHEHWDHLSGFVEAQAEFDRLSVGEVWLAWTEKPGDHVADELRQRRRRAQRAAALALQALRADGETAFTEQLSSLLGFEGELAADGTSTTAAALDWVKRRPNAEVRYLFPGDRAPAAGDLDGMTVYVLGPPHDERLIRRSRPSKRNSQVYELGADVGDDCAFYAATEQLDGGALEEAPFEEFFALPEREAATRSSLQPYFASASGWRRADRDWLGVAGRLALQLNSDTNNTSLVLAFELGVDGPVLLFPGDAQVGNWESWHDVALAREDTTTLTANDLLARTVLYKVGHHGSHNATLRQLGLELMVSPELAAMIPVNRATAAKHRWLMPFDPLLERLRAKTGDRILDAEKGLLFPGTGARWNAFKSRAKVRQLSIDYVVDW